MPNQVLSQAELISQIKQFCLDNYAEKKYRFDMPVECFGPEEWAEFAGGIKPPLTFAKGLAAIKKVAREYKEQEMNCW